MPHGKGVGMRDLYRTEAGRERVRGWCSARIDAWPVPHDKALVATRLGSTHALLSGAGSAAVVFLPGTNFNAATSLRLLGHLAAHCRVFAVDLPGQPGLSTPHRPGPDAREHGAWMSEVLTALPMSGVDRVVLVGHSRGAYVGLCTDPQDVDALVLLNPAGFVSVAASMAVLGAAIPWALWPTERRSRALLQLMTAPGRDVDPDQVAWLTLVARDTRTSGAPGPVPQPVTDRWRSGAVRVLSGGADCFFPTGRLAPAVRGRLGVDLEVLPEAGHLSVEDATQVVAHRILGILFGD